MRRTTTSTKLACSPLEERAGFVRGVVGTLDRSLAYRGHDIWHVLSTTRVSTMLPPAHGSATVKKHTYRFRTLVEGCEIPDMRVLLALEAGAMVVVECN